MSPPRGLSKTVSSTLITPPSFTAFLSSGRDKKMADRLDKKLKIDDFSKPSESSPIPYT